MASTLPGLVAQDLPLPRHEAKYHKAVFAHPDLLKAYKAFPEQELLYGMLLMKAAAPNKTTPFEEAKMMMTANHWFNPLCHACKAKGPELPLNRCAGCHLIFYCSSACQSKDWPRHSKECGIVSAALDMTNPYLPVVVKVKDDK